MTDDIDVEAMLEAPFQKSSEKEAKKKSEKKSRKRSRSRSRSRSRRHRRSRSRSRSRDRKRGSRGGKRSRSRERRRHRSRSPRRSPKRVSPPKPRSPSPPDRDARTIFCMQLAQRIRVRDLEEFFSSVGKVREVKLIQDKHSKRSKGIAYVEFKDLESIPLALGLSGQKLLGVPIVVQPTQSEKNKIAAAQLSLQKAALGPTKLYVGSLHENITEEMIKGIFSPFGRVEQVQIIKDDAGASRGYGFITFAEAECAKRALDQLNGFEIAGKPIKLNTVSYGTDMNAMQGLASGPSFLDNDAVERAGIDLGTTGRLQLMAKLAEGTGLEVPSAAQQALYLGQSMGLGLPQSATGTTGAPPIATTCFQLSNMFDPLNETGSSWDKEIRDDVIEECQRHGAVYHVFVDKQSKGNVYVKCDSVSAAANSVAALHGRYFAGNMITAAYVPVVNYHSLFPDAAYSTTPLKPGQ
ncbi:RNA-binding protein 39-like [Ciona intestinalis]